MSLGLDPYDDDDDDDEGHGRVDEILDQIRRYAEQQRPTSILPKLTREQVTDILGKIENQDSRQFWLSLARMGSAIIIIGIALWAMANLANSLIDSGKSDLAVELVKHFAAFLTGLVAGGVFGGFISRKRQ